MAENIDGKKIFSLLEVTTSIQKALALRYTSSFWVKAEMNKLNHYPHSGHCYPDLVEKIDGRVIAQLKSTLWRDDYIRINKNFLAVVKLPLKDGIKMLFCARVTFDPIHGLSLRITDIDPVFSLGELEREKQDSISELRREGVFDRNRSLQFPLLPKRLAIISVQTSKGYADFKKMIDENPWGYTFIHVLFPSLLQGDRAIESIRYQLARIRKVASHFDVVAIIRGGGGDVGLSCFNDFQLSKDIALFPIPVLTGIGHATNETVVEMVSYRNAITPTELADFLLQRFHNYSVPVLKAQETIAAHTRRIIADERQRFFHAVKYFRSVTGNVLIRSHHQVEHQARDLFRQAHLNIRREKQRHSTLIHNLRNFTLSLCSRSKLGILKDVFIIRKDIVSFFRHKNEALAGMSRTVSNMHPHNVLKRGYSITRRNGKAITSAGEVGLEDQLETILPDGTVLSEVKSVQKSANA